MQRRSAAVLFSLSALAAIVTACGTLAVPAAHQQDPPDPTATPFPQGKIQHVVIIVQENRTTDNLFNGLPGADTVTSGKTSSGATVALQPVALGAPYELGHEHADFKSDHDGGKMDGFDREPSHAPADDPSPPPDAAYRYVQQSDTVPYFELAERFAFADRMFQSNQGSSFPAHQYLIGGTSAPSVGSTLLAEGNPGDAAHDRPQGGCDSPSDMRVGLIDPSGNENYQQYPCFDHPTLIDLLDAKNISWIYYEPQRGGFWDGPAAISRVRFNPADWARVIVPQTTVLSDIKYGRLAQVSWVIPNGVDSDHPGDGSGGPAWVASIVNAIGASQYWSSTAIFITWDDWGGWYDHVAPPIRNSYELSFRVPLVVVSPYAKAGYVSHVTHEFGSILKFVETNWGLGVIGYTDVRSDNLSDCFDFTQTPTSYRPLHHAFSPDHYLRAREAFVPPDND